ncbi:MAG: TOBE domain-containing protein [Desulfovibrio sp.]|jgi:molybdate transport system regulatory protein|nr:TOBE domain-containing protein [Desulfovibrio sp.]
MFDPQSIINSAGRGDLRLLVAAAEKKLAEYGDDAQGSVYGNLGLVTALIPEGTRCLSTEELDRSAAGFEAWRAGAKTPLQSRSRTRLCLAFLLLRHAALRLGELLALNDVRDIRPARRLVLVRGSHARQVPLPAPVMDNIANLLALPMFYGMRGEVLKLDQGYLRRKFYQRARAGGFSAALFNPKTIRQSRGIELLRQGMPLQVAQSYLGLPPPPKSVNYLEFSGEAVNRIMQHCIKREGRMKTSARNTFIGKISAIKSDGLLTEVELKTLSGLSVVSVVTDESRKVLGLAEGEVVTAAIKAPWVLIGTGDAAAKSSARNKFPGKVTEVRLGEVACEVLAELAEGTQVSAVVTRQSVKELDLAPGREVLIMFKAFAVVLNI